MHFIKLIYLKMKMIITINLVLIMVALINAQAIFQVHSHSGSYCEYETGLGRVNIQVKLLNEILENDKSSFIYFNMTLQDKSENEYKAKCKIEYSDGVITSSYCQFDPPKVETYLYYKKNSLFIIEGSDEVQFNEDFYIIAQGCNNNENDNGTENNISTQTDELTGNEIIDNITENNTANLTDELTEEEIKDNITDNNTINVTDEFSDNFTFTSDEIDNNTNQTTSNITETEKKLDISLSFRQINFFVFYNY